MELKFNSQVCTTIEQSKKLLELGLKPETADMYYTEKPRLLFIRDNGILLEEEDFPAWSLHRLMEILETTIIDYSKDDNPYEDVIYNISESIKNGYINKEYLKE
jgi:hypothetical protein